MARRKVFLLMIVANWMLFFSPSIFSSQQSQQIDPFYRTLFEKAQKSFLAKNYTEAAKDLEIASFGLTADKNLKAKAYIYLGLCRYYLKDTASSEKYLREAADLVGEQGFENLQIYESALPDLEKLLTFFNLKPAQGIVPPLITEKPIQTNPVDPKKSEEKAPEKSAQNELSKPPQITLDNLKEGDLLTLDMVDTRPVILKRVQADYPAPARRSRLEGRVMVNALISEKGDVIKTEIIQGIKGAFGFNQESQRAVRNWKFEPATIKGIKVKVWMPIAIEFKVK
jgi:TonB family protein